MKIESNPENKFTTNFTSFTLVGFHGTSSLACEKIEANGFLPDKVFNQIDHQNILNAASLLTIETDYYRQWLLMRSVTFAQEAKDAISHVKYGSSGGQGLKNMTSVLTEILGKGSDQQKEFATNFIEQVKAIRNNSSVVYAVDLSDLGAPLVQDKHKPFHFYWNPNVDLPKISEISPSRLIARLDLTEP